MTSSDTPRSIGRYELVSLLGRGGAGEVWEAVLRGPRGFRKPVALKVVHAGLEVRSPQGQSLVQEARLGALLSHPNVVGIYELGETDDHQLYVAMELVRGDSVLDLVRERQLSPASILDIGIQACAGLEHIHRLEVDGVEAGLVHRDIKPSNLLVHGSGLVKIADLGVARLTGQSEELIAGTPGYMPPEQLEGREDARADLFGLGVTLFVLAAGVRPFGGGPPALRRVQQVEGLLAEPAFLGRVDARVPGLGAILRGCFRYDPEKRWASAARLAEALRELRGAQLGAGLLQHLHGPPTLSTDHAGLALLDDTTEITEERPVGRLLAAEGDFFGREPELVALDEALTEGGVAVLLGPAGAGKSRLALEQALRQQEQGRRVYRVDLEGQVLEAELLRAVSGALDVPLASREPLRRLGRALRALGRAEVVLDNVEGMVGPVSRAVESWRAEAPSLRWVLTSRRPLRLDGAVTLAVDGLDAATGAALFLARAAVPPRDGEGERVADLVRRVDGLPLAIELAAARTRVASLEQILARLDLRMLSGSGAERRRSLRLSFDASYDRLSVAEQVALRQLSVFRDGFTLEAAEGVLHLSHLPESPWALDVLDGLLDHSLVRMDATSGRFSLLHTVRAYGDLLLQPEERAGAERRHGTYYAQLGSVEAVAALHSHGGELRLQAMGSEVGNLEVAIERALARGDLRTAELVALGLWEVVQLHGPFDHGLGILERVVEARAEEASARLLAAVGRAATLAGSAEQARHYLERGLKAAKAQGDPAAEAVAEGNLGYLERDAGDIDGARRRFERCLAGFKGVGDRWGEGRALYRLAMLHYHQSRMQEARGLYEASLRAFREVGDRRHEAGVLTSYALVLSDLGDNDEAIRRGEQGLAFHRELGNRHTEAVALTNLGILYRREGRLHEARDCYEAALRVNRSIGNRRLEGATLGNVGTLLAELGDLEGAARAFEAALAAHREVGNRHYEGVVLGNYADVLLRQGDLVGARQRLGFALGVAASVGDRSMEGAFLGVLGEVLEGLGDRDGADARLDEARGILHATSDRSEEARVVLRQVEVARGRGDLDRARALLDEAEALCLQLSERSNVWHRFRAVRARL